MGDDDVIFEAAKVSAPAVREAAGASGPCPLEDTRRPLALGYLLPIMQIGQENNRPFLISPSETMETGNIWSYLCPGGTGEVDIVLRGDGEPASPSGTVLAQSAADPGPPRGLSFRRDGLWGFAAQQSE